MALHCTEPFIIIFPHPRFDLNNVERDIIHQIIATDRRGYLHNIFLTSPRKYILWVLIGSASVRHFQWVPIYHVFLKNKKNSCTSNFQIKKSALCGGLPNYHCCICYILYSIYWCWKGTVLMYWLICAFTICICPRKEHWFVPAHVFWYPAYLFN